MRVSIGREKNRNFRQDTGRTTALSSRTLVAVSEINHHQRKRLSRFEFVKTVMPHLSIVFAILFACELGRAQAPAEVPPPAAMSDTTILIFADRRMEDSEWTALIAALRSNA